MKFSGLLQSLFLTTVGIGIGFFIGIYLEIAYQEIFDICPFRGGIDCINYLSPFPVISALSGPFAIFIIRDIVRKWKKRHT